MDIMRIDPVYVYETTPEADEEIRFCGSLFLKQKSEHTYLEWKINEDFLKKSSPKNNLRHFKHMLDFNIEDLKSAREARSNIAGSMKLTFILKCGSTLPSLHLPLRDSQNLIHKLKQYTSLVKCAQDKGLYVVRSSKTYDDYHLFDVEPGVEAISKYLMDPMAGLTKVTKYLHELRKDINSNIREGIATVTTVQGQNVPGVYKDLEAYRLHSDNGSEFEFLAPAMKDGDLPPRPNVTRGSPITARDWSKHIDSQGAISNPSALKELIFRNGVDGSIRQEVWKYLLGYYQWHSTSKMRVEQRKSKIDDYFRMKLQWKSIDDEQLKRFSALRDCRSLVDKDVLRTDRNHKFFEGRNNPNLSMLHDILLTHCMHDFDLGYVQGMSDLLAPVLVIMEHEVDAFWTFAGFCRFLKHNFESDQQSMKNQLSQLQFLIKFIDPDFSNYLDKHDSLNMYFCFRWLLIIFKREFSFPDIMKLWEILWTGLPCQNFHLLVCLSILDTIKSTLIENDFGFTEILKLVNDLSGRIDVEEVLKIAEGMYIQLNTCTSLPSSIKKILGLHEFHDPSLSSPFLPFNPFDEKSSPKKYDNFGGGNNSNGSNSGSSNGKVGGVNCGKKSIAQKMNDSRNISPASETSDKMPVSQEFSFAADTSLDPSLKESDSLEGIDVVDPFSDAVSMN